MTTYKTTDRNYVLGKKKHDSYCFGHTERENLIYIFKKKIIYFRVKEICRNRPVQ